MDRNVWICPKQMRTSSNWKTHLCRPAVPTSLWKLAWGNPSQKNGSGLSSKWTASFKHEPNMVSKSLPQVWVPKFSPSIGLWLQIQVVGEDCQFLYLQMALSSLIFSHAFHFCLLGWAYRVPLGASVRAPEPDPADPSDLVLVQIADPQLGMLNMYTKPSDSGFCLRWCFIFPIGNPPWLGNRWSEYVLFFGDPLSKSKDWSKEELMLQTLADKALAMKPQHIDLWYFSWICRRFYDLLPIKIRIHDLGSRQFVNIAGV